MAEAGLSAPPRFEDLDVENATAGNPAGARV